jgi:MFS family permease
VLDALRDRRFRLLWLAGLAASTARWMDLVVLGWLSLALTDSPLLVGVAAFCRAAPMMLLGPFAGVVADRFPRGRIMLTVQAANVAVTLALAGLFAAGAGRFIGLVALETLLGVAWAVDFPSRRTVLITLVGRERLTNAISLESVSTQGSKMLGPLVGGILLARGGAVACYAVLALLSAAALVAVRCLDRATALPGTPGGEPVLTALAAGLREARQHRATRGVLLVTILMNTLVFPYQQMLPVFARDVLGAGPALLGVLVAAEGLGALAGALTLATYRGMGGHTRIFAGSSAASALLVVAFSASPWYALSLALQFAIGVAGAGFGTMQSAIVLLAASPAARGRVMGILSACIGTQPLGSLWIGVFAAAVGAPAAAGLEALLAFALMVPVGLRLAATRVVVARAPLEEAG